MLPQRRRGRPFKLCHFRMAENHAQHVVEVVGHAAGQPAHRFDLLGLAELLPQLFPFSDVGNDPDQGLQRAVRVDQALAGEKTDKIAAVGPAVMALDGDRLDLPPDQLQHQLPTGLPLLRANPLGIGAADQRVEGHAEHLGHAVVGEPDRPLRVDQDDPRLGGVEDGAQLRLAVPHRFFRLLAVGNILEIAAPDRGFARRRRIGLRVDQQPLQAAGGGDDADLRGKFLPGQIGRQVLPVKTLEILGMNQGPDQAHILQQGIGIEFEDLAAGAGGHIEETAVAVRFENGIVEHDRQGVGHPFVTLLACQQLFLHPGGDPVLVLHPQAFPMQASFGGQRWRCL